ncbi:MULTISPECIES: PP2C family protein-serine/threonine phosphatase [Pantoea]|uniref:Serine/threonine-protein phosphatase n=1 Tax=Candidatus Pantoea multigeneris TaxID=2608357 RepID=A0ABX0R492_9GAMM|nr:PP2C family serine/threonine-protein phosphatase [Pantoea sp. A4]NIF20220.1 serine/threonine-protein phosphatase [Pantoea multigeneris]
MNITTASISKQGDRASNQDHIGDRIGERAACFVVCDGVAGLPGGEVASLIARNAIVNAFDASQPLDAQRIRTFVADAQQAIRHEQQQNQQNRRMSTTLVGLFLDRDHELAYWAHAGDSRLYLFRRGYIREVTTDHSLVQRMRDAGHATEGINSNMLYFALGMEDEGRDASYSEVVPIEDGDAFLLCTDGFWHDIDERQMEQSLHMVNTPEEWLTLMQQIIASQPRTNGERQDNFSAQAVWVGSPQDTTLLHSLAETAQFIPARG